MKCMRRSKPYLTEASIKEIEQKGKYMFMTGVRLGNANTRKATTKYVYMQSEEKSGMIKCAFEQAYYDEDDSIGKNRSVATYTRLL